MKEVHYKICPICGMSMGIEETKCPACGYDGLQTTGGFGRTITNEQNETIPKPSINIQEIKHKIQEAEEEHAYWQHFRRETARDILAGMMAHPKVVYGVYGVSVSRLAEDAVICADALIAKLKER
jgi:hypothetical protein